MDANVVEGPVDIISGNEAASVFKIITKNATEPSDLSLEFVLVDLPTSRSSAGTPLDY